MHRLIAIVALLASSSLLACLKPAPPVDPDAGQVVDTTAPDPVADPAPDPVADPAPDPAADDGTAATTPPSGQCLRDADCDSGVCEGQGCGDDQPGTCAPADRMCTRDSRPYCGCDGKTFRSSGSCPGRRYASPGECSSSPPTP